MFQRRPQSTLIAQRNNRSTVRQFINHVSTSAAIPRPIDDLLIGTHANDEGFLFIPMFPGQNGATVFETLEDAIADAAKSIAIPDATIGHNAGDPITHSFHIKGCNIGKARPILVKLKEALGDNVHVTAPKHFHMLYYHSHYGVWEAMEYEFKIIRPNAFANRAAALADFQSNANFTRIDGSAIPAADWNKWLPTRINRNNRKTVNVNLGQQIGSRSTIPALQEFRSRTNQFVYTIAFPSAADVPANRAAREAARDQSLNNNPRFDANHDFPEYQRWGYRSVADFIQGYNWNFGRNGRRLVCTGERHEYTVIVPILDPATGNIIFNFYPNAGSPHAAVTNGLVVSDARFFETV